MRQLGVRVLLAFGIAIMGLPGGSIVPHLAAAQDEMPAAPLVLAASLEGSGNTRSVAWGDVDGDGDLDLAVGNFGQPNRLYRNDGGKLTLDATWQPAARPTESVAWGDVDGDGDLDLAVGNFGQPNQLYLNDSGKLSTPPIELGKDTNTNSVAWGDVDGDGDLDLAVGNQDQPNQLYLNDSGTFSTPPIELGTNTNTQSLAWGDVDGDGDLDLAVGNFGQSNQLYLNNSGTFSTPPIALGTNTNTRSLAWGDVDGDGNLDLAVGNVGQANQLYLNENKVLILSDWNPAAVSTESVAWGDVDGDGDLDLAVGNYLAPSQLYLNNGGVLELSAWQPEARSTESVAWGDVDGDGDLDLVVSQFGESSQIYRNDGTTISSKPDWNSGGQDISSLAWGDVDGDGDLDLAVGNYNQPNQLYLNDSGKLTLDATWQPAANWTTSLAWGDVDGDGDLDLAVGNSDESNQLYRNNNGKLTLDATWQPAANWTTSLAWGDVDGDGDLDLAVGNFGRPNQLYRNNNGKLTLDATWQPEARPTQSLAWGDVDGDGDLDLAVGNYLEPNQLYRNNKGVLTLDETWKPERRYTTSLAWGDVDGDGDLDLVIGNAWDPSQLYRNDGGTLVLSDWRPPGRVTQRVAWGDVDGDGDGDLDLAVGNDDQPSQLYLNNGGVLELSAWQPDPWKTASLAWGDVDGDGDLDLALASREEIRIHYNRRNDSVPQIRPPAIAISLPSLPGAGGYANPQILDSREISFTYTLSHPASQPARRLRAQISLDGGGSWQDAWPKEITDTQRLRSSPDGHKHTYVLDTVNSGIYGQTDQAVLRLIADSADPEIAPNTSGQLAPNSLGSYHLSGPFMYASSASASLPFRLRGVQARVVSADQPAGVSGALVYKLPAGQEKGARLLTHRFTRAPIASDQHGYVASRDPIRSGDRLVALAPIASTATYTLYHTSALPTPRSLDAFSVQTGGVQTLTVKPTNPLILFNLEVSLEWDAQNDPIFRAQLVRDIERASELLYDWSDGQIALGMITVYENREHWDDAHIRIYATNRMRPNAAKGGIVTATLSETVTISNTGRTATISQELSYDPGQLRMGSVWNRYGEATINLGDDWPRTLAHEIGHFALFLDDNYLGLDNQGRLINVSSCPGAMSDPYRDSEFQVDPRPATVNDPNGWDRDCADTLSERLTGRSDWETIKALYDSEALKFRLNQPAAYNSNPGPTLLPLAVTQVRFGSEMESDAAPLIDEPVLLLADKAGQQLNPLPGVSARGFLFQAGDPENDKDDYLIDLGVPTVDQLLARGARRGDRVCLYEPGAGRLGCSEITIGYQQLRLAPLPDWRPDLRLTPVSSTSLHLELAGISETLTLKARLYPSSAPAQPPLKLDYDPAKEVYTADLSSPASTPAFEGYVHVWVEESSTSTEFRRETIAEFRLGGNPGAKWKRSAPRGNPGAKWKRSAPVLSSDGQALLYVPEKDLPEGAFYAVIASDSAPPPPGYVAPVSRAYRVTASAGLSFNGASLNIGYFSDDVPRGYESGVAMYRYNEAGRRWVRLTSDLDQTRNEATAAITGPGLYQLMVGAELSLSRAGWNLLYFYPGADAPLPQALESIRDSYTSLYGYKAADSADPWKLYDVNVPAWVNDLGELHYGESYWIAVTKPTTATVRPQTQAGLAQTGILAPPPATYYGVLPAGIPAKQPVTARIGEVVCGASSTRAVGGRIVFVVDVLSEGSQAGCGLPGRQVVITIGELQFTANWESGPRDLLLSRKVYLPFSDK